MVTGTWLGPLNRLLDAESLLAAQRATAEVMDEAVPGGSAVADDGAELARAIADVEGVAAHPFRAYLLWILVLMQRWIGVWQVAAAARTAGSRTLAAAAREREAERELERAARTLAGMVDDIDPEVRSMAYRLVGGSLPPREAVEALAGRVSRGVSDLAKACGVEAVVLAIVRAWPGVPTGGVDWLREAVDNGGDVVRGRIRHLLDGRALVGRTHAVEAVVGEVVNDVDSLPREGPFWTVETI
jgi:hypothetical protein